MTSLGCTTQNSRAEAPSPPPCPEPEELEQRRFTRSDGGEHGSTEE